MIPKHLIDLNDFPLDSWERIIALAKKIKQRPADYTDRMKGRIMATLFYEPSTRTQMSFQTAMLRLGGQIIGFDNPSNSSVAKGETLRDTIKIISGYADILVVRHPLEGSARAAAMESRSPVINAGDGGHLHPTQTLTDLVTLSGEIGRLDHLRVGFCGDLKYGRTVHSLLKALAQFPGNEFVLISTPALSVPAYIRDLLDAHGCRYQTVHSLEEAIPSLDVLYMTRIQRERFASEQEYEEQKNVYVLTPEKMLRAKPSLKVLHPLPRVDEIDLDVDRDSRALYFDQAIYGMYVRMALILTMLEQHDASPLPSGHTHPGYNCSNPNCVTHRERYLPHLFKESGDMLVCDYCDERILI